MSEGRSDRVPGTTLNEISFRIGEGSRGVGIKYG